MQILTQTFNRISPPPPPSSPRENIFAIHRYDRKHFQHFRDGNERGLKKKKNERENFFRTCSDCVYTYVFTRLVFISTGLRSKF